MAGSGALGTTAWPLASKCARNRRLISAVLIACLPKWDDLPITDRVFAQVFELVVERHALGEGLVDLGLALGHAVADVVDEATDRLDQAASGFRRASRRCPPA